MARPRRRIKSAERTLALLELFSRERQPVTVGAVARALAMPQPSASMLLGNLRDLGYLHHDPASRTFSPSIRVALLGSWVNRRFAEAGAIGEALNRLQRATGETAFLGIQNGAAAQYIMRQRADRPDRLLIESGLYRSLTSSALGRALLMAKPDHEVLGLVRRSNAEARDDREKVNVRDFLAAIRRFRQQGHAETAGDSRPGLSAIALPFRSPMGQESMAVGVGGASANIRHKRQRILRALRAFKAAYDPPPSSGTP
jgi:IclR family KDG regulon transcriptional repressor